MTMFYVTSVLVQYLYGFKKGIVIIFQIENLKGEKFSLGQTNKKWLKVRLMVEYFMKNVSYVEGVNLDN